LVPGSRAADPRACDQLGFPSAPLTVPRRSSLRRPHGRPGWLGRPGTAGTVTLSSAL